MTRTRAALAANLLLPVAAALALGIGAATYDAPLAGWVGFDHADRSGVPVNVPTWANSDAASQPGAVSLERLAGDLPRAWVVSNREGHTHVVRWTPASEAAIKRSGRTETHDDDLYVVGAIR